MDIPIAAQIVGLLIGGVVAGQIITLLIVMLVPPPRPDVFRLSEIAAVLNGQKVHPKDGRDLSRVIGPPPAVTLGPPGRRAHFIAAANAELAMLLGVPAQRVRLMIEHRNRPAWEFEMLGPPFRLQQSDRGPGPGPAMPRQGAGGPDSPYPRFDGPADRNTLIFETFTAALQQPNGQWVVVSPTREVFPFVWQARIVTWFLICLAVFGPAGYLFARRLVSPIGAFAKAADRLGRDPRGEFVELHGPAEIGVAARAFNEMQTRLKRYVEDRTTMIGAISHDLRTPLTRIRFKLESATPELRAAVAPDIDQMEAMISAALAFVHDATQTHERETLDLLSVLECVVDDARSGGGDVALLDAAPLAIEGDALALQRLFANLVDNAVKYGGLARVRLHAELGDAVAEIADAGAGLPQTELERVFEPFYRTEPSRNRDTGGIGLGLAVARSVARAHGGDVKLRSTIKGLVAEVRLPLARPGAEALAAAE